MIIRTRQLQPGIVSRDIKVDAADLLADRGQD
jgi:hypothetical protein